MSGIVGDNTGRGSGVVQVAAVAADAITGAEIADDAVDSEHYVAASIDNEHLADNAVGTDEIADNAVTLAKMAGGTDGNIISYDASGDPVAIATGTDGQVLTSAGAGAPPAFEDAGGGAWTLIGSQVASNDASLTQTGLDSTYATYACVVSDLDTQNNAVILYVRLGDSSGIDSGTSDYKYRTEYNLSGGATSSAQSNGANHMQTILYTGYSAGRGAHAVFYLGNHSTNFAHIHGTYSTADNGGYDASGSFGGHRTSVITVDRIQIFLSGGNILSGRFSVYGLKHT